MKQIRLQSHSKSPLLSSSCYSVLYISGEDTAAGLVDMNGFIMEETEFENLVLKIRHFYGRMREEGIDITRENMERLAQYQYDDKPQAQRRRRKLPGYVYLFKNRDDLYKIGRSAKPEQRANSLSLPNYPIEIVHTIKTDDMVVLERHLHEHFAKNRVEGEWFCLTPDDVEFVKEYSSDRSNEED